MPKKYAKRNEHIYFADDPSLRKYVRDFESGRRNPDGIKCTFWLSNGQKIDRPIQLTNNGAVAKQDKGLFDA